MLAVTAHPDDESLGMGGAPARYAEEGVGVYLVCATRGENGRCGYGHELPPPEEVGRIRERELHAAAHQLGIREVTLRGYEDGALDRADPREATASIAHQLQGVRPQVVVTFGPEGAYGHPDHIAVCQLATAAVVSAAAPCGGSPTSAEEPHQVSKLYSMAWPPNKWAAYQAAFRDLKSVVDGVERRAVPWPNWAVTTVLDTRPWWPQVWKAVCCHRSQLAICAKLERLPTHEHEYLWGSQEFYRVFSLVNGGRLREEDLFAGLRGRADRVAEGLP